MRFLRSLSLIVLAITSLLTSVTAGESNSKDANAIIRYQETIFTVNSIGSGTTTFKTAITVLNKYGDHHATLYVGYDKLNKIDYIKAELQDAQGKKIKHLKNSEIKDVGAVSNSSLMDDNRVKIAELSHTIYPYTVQFEYKVHTNNMMFYPFWRPLDEENLKLEKASLSIEMPTGMKLRYRESNMPFSVVKEKTSTHDIYRWELSNLDPIRQEPYGPPLAEVVPQVRTAPADFEVEGYVGNMETWKDYGLWIEQLNSGRDVLPAETQEKLKAMVAGLPSTEEKIKAIYAYLQGKTRYVSIQLGIGGWQPFEASLVDNKGYGDCKALTNYTQAMLKAVGIPSYQALILAGDDESDILTDFPSSQFNHVILSVPTEKDTLWLECTSQQAPAGYNGSFTGGRHALLITPAGGKLVNTPDYLPIDNQQKRIITVQIDELGNGKATVNSIYTGLQQESRDNIIHGYKPEDQKKWLYQQTKIPSFEINSFSLQQKKKTIPEVAEKMELSLNRYASLSGKRMFLDLNLMNKWTYAPAPLENRKTEVVRTMSFLDTDTITYSLPAGYTLEHKPQNLSYKTEFGEYKFSVEVEGQQIKYVRILRMNKGKYKPETYPAYLEFMNNIIKGDKQQVVLVKNVAN